MYYGWIHGYYARESANRAGASALDAKDAARRAENAMVRLEDAIDRQALIIRTLLSICEQKGVFNEAEFKQLMNDVDLSDGRLDGKFKPQATPRACPSCGKTNGKRAVTCMYCGVPLEDREVL
ncbi:MAG: zinc ribbon domain-containing protein [Planctomycetes bacterium]|nr:zinc ribbon domain-containing protein [Planctomycetota bacterium]MCW8134608.1 zinc ribbon domain-containing protein [Planctomycetota bacterium]